MTKTNADNERIKRAYLRYLRNAKGLSETTIDKAASAILRLENAIAFKTDEKRPASRTLLLHQHHCH